MNGSGKRYSLWWNVYVISFTICDLFTFFMTPSCFQCHSGICVLLWRTYRLNLPPLYKNKKKTYSKYLHWYNYIYVYRQCRFANFRNNNRFQRNPHRSFINDLPSVISHFNISSPSDSQKLKSVVFRLCVIKLTW